MPMKIPQRVPVLGVPLLILLALSAPLILPSRWSSSAQGGQGGGGMLAVLVEGLDPTEIEYHYEHFLLTTAVTQDEAEAYCNNQGGWLGTISSAEKMAELKAQFGTIPPWGYAMWLGGSNGRSDLAWYWKYGPPGVQGTLITYFNWGLYQPDSPSEVQSLGFWAYDGYSFDRRYYQQNDSPSSQPLVHVLCQLPPTPTRTLSQSTTTTVSTSPRTFSTTRSSTETVTQSATHSSTNSVSVRTPSFSSSPSKGTQSTTATAAPTETRPRTVSVTHSPTDSRTLSPGTYSHSGKTGSPSETSKTLRISPSASPTWQSPSLLMTLQSLDVAPEDDGSGGTTSVPLLVTVLTNTGAAVGVSMECVAIAVALSSWINFDGLSLWTSLANNYTCASAYPGVRCEIPRVEPSGVELGLTVSFPSYYNGNLTVECTLIADNTLPESLTASLLLQQENVSVAGSNSSAVGSATGDVAKNRNTFGATFLQCSDPLLFTTLGTVLTMLGALLVTLVWRRHIRRSGTTDKKRKSHHLTGAPASLWRSLLLHHSYIQVFLPCKVECVISHSFLICSHMMCLLFLVAAVTAAGFYSPTVTETYQWGAAVAALLVLIATVQPLSNWFYWKTTDDFVLQESLKYLSSSEALSVARQQSRSGTTSGPGTSSKATTTGTDLEDDKVYVEKQEEPTAVEKKRQLVASLAMYTSSSKAATTSGNPTLQQSMAALEDVQLDDGGGTTTFGSSNTQHSSSEGAGTLTFGSTSGGLGGTTTADSNPETTGGTAETVVSQKPDDEGLGGTATESNIPTSASGLTGTGGSVGTTRECQQSTGELSIANPQTEEEGMPDKDKKIGGKPPHASDISERIRSGEKEDKLEPSTEGSVSGEETVCVGVPMELAEPKLLTKYRSIGHATNCVMIVLAALGSYIIITTTLSTTVETTGSGRGGVSSCDFFVLSLWKAILLDIFCAQPAVVVAVLGYRWLVSGSSSECDDISDGGDEGEEESGVAPVLHP